MARSPLQTLKRSEDFAAVKARGLRVGSGPLVVSFLPRGGARRLGIVITRHVGGAVQRNRIRRVVREFFRTGIGTFPEGDCVIVPRNGSAELENDALRHHLERALNRLAKRVAEHGGAGR